MVKNTNDFNEIDILKKTLEQLKSPWEFQGNEKSVKVETSIIEDINYNFLGIINDFYFIESLDKLEEFEKQDSDIILTLERISNHHNFLLFLKYFYQTELKNYLDYLININPKTKEISLNFYAFKNVSEVWNFLLSKSKIDKYPLKLLVLIELYKNLLNSNEDKESTDIVFFSDEYTVTNINNNLSIFKSQYDLKEYLKIIASLTLIIDTITASLNNLINYVQTSLLLFFKNKSNSEHAYSIFRELSSIESTVSTFEDKIRTEELCTFYKKKVNCLASASYNNEKFIAINGLDTDSVNTDNKYEKIIRIIQELAKPAEFKSIQITDEVKYYLDPTIEIKYTRNNITYKMFKNYKKNYNNQGNVNHKKISDENKDNIFNDKNRMFTCCERKLIDNIIEESTENEYPNIELIITMEPCPLCIRTIEYLKRENKHELKIHHSQKKSKLSIDTIKKYDDFAIEILDSEPQKENSYQFKRT